MSYTIFLFSSFFPLLQSLHKDKYGKPKKLNAAQLESIRRWGYVFSSEIIMHLEATCVKAVCVDW
jgi:hypothetical protein